MTSTKFWKVISGSDANGGLCIPQNTTFTVTSNIYVAISSAY